jgi:NADP-dependent 3-hydroxy acid dehydrogenase YdfG
VNAVLARQRLSAGDRANRAVEIRRRIAASAATVLARSHSVTNPVLLITGASTGIGAATARLAAARGWRIVLTARSPQPLADLADELGGPAIAVPAPCDTTEWSQVSTLPDLARTAFGRLDAVLANAGYWADTSFLHGTGTPEQWREMVLTNVYGTALVARATLPSLKEHCGHLVLTGSVTGRVTVPGQLYSATKWAVTAMAQSIRAEAATTGIRVTVVQPGLVDTAAASPDRHADPKLAPDDIARTVLFALDQPKSVDVNEIVVRPTGQNPHR